MIHADETVRKAIYRRTRYCNDGVYYTLAATKRHNTIDKARSYRARRLAKRSVKLTGRDAWVLGRLEAGWVPMWRYTRRYDSDGGRVEDRVLTAVPPDTHLRAVSSKPGYRKRA